MTEVFFTKQTSVLFNNARVRKITNTVLCLATGSNGRVIIVRPRRKQLRALQSAVMKKKKRFSYLH